MTGARLTLVLGGTRSGKSAWAEAQILAAGLPGRPVYLATGAAGDAEMAERIRRHRQRRGDDWETLEATLDPAGALAGMADPERAVLLDCLTLWLANMMAAGLDPEAGGEALAAALKAAPGPVFVVSGEVGLGIVPDNALAREFRDRAGYLNQRIAALADRVVLVAAGLPLELKGPGGPGSSGGPGDGGRI